MTDRSCQIYLVAPTNLDRVEPLQAFAAALPAILESGVVACLLLPTADGDERGLTRAGLQLVEICKAAGVAFLVEDKAELALACDADGVHLNRPPKSVTGLRGQIGPGAVIGVFCGTSRHQGLMAAEASADYIAFGPVDEEISDLDGDEPLGEVLEWWQAMMTPPVVAMATADPADLPGLAHAGADFITLGDLVWQDPDPVAVLRRISQSLAEALA